MPQRSVTRIPLMRRDCKEVLTVVSSRYRKRLAAALLCAIVTWPLLGIVSSAQGLTSANWKFLSFGMYAQPTFQPKLSVQNCENREITIPFEFGGALNRRFKRWYAAYDRTTLAQRVAEEVISSMPELNCVVVAIEYVSIDSTSGQRVVGRKFHRQYRHDTE